ALGAGTVVGIDLSEDRLRLAAAAGAVPVHADLHVVRSVRELTDGRGADVAIEAVGTLAGFTTARTVVRRGGRIVLLGVHGGGSAGTWYVVVAGPVMSPPMNSVRADGSDAGLAEKMCTLCATFGSTLSKPITTGVFAGAARHFVSKTRFAALRLIVVPLGAHE